MMKNVPIREVYSASTYSLKLHVLLVQVLKKTWCLCNRTTSIHIVPQICNVAKVNINESAGGWCTEQALDLRLYTSLRKPLLLHDIVHMVVRHMTCHLLSMICNMFCHMTCHMICHLVLQNTKLVPSTICCIIIAMSHSPNVIHMHWRGRNAWYMWQCMVHVVTCFPLLQMCLLLEFTLVFTSICYEL